MSDIVVTDFYLKSPEKVYEEAHKYTKQIHRVLQLPASHSKSKYIKNLAEEKKDEVKFTIQQNKYQNQVFKRLEENDQKKRHQYMKKLDEKDMKIQNNLEEKRKQFQKSVQKVNKQHEEVHKKYKELSHRIKQNKDEQALKLRKSLLQFYEKQQERRKKADHKQVKVGTCRGDALTRKQKIQQKNEQFAEKSEKYFMMKMARNSAKEKNLLNLSRIKSAQNKRKQSVYENNCQIEGEKEYRYIQTYCQDLDASIKAFEFKENTEQKTKQRIHKFFKQRIEKWHTHKKRVDEDKSHVSERCINLMDKSNKASFRQTFSSFRDSFRGWNDRVRQNKSVIYKRDEEFRNKILNEQLDMRLRNTSSFQVQQRMDSMRAKAKILAKDFL